MGAAWVGVGGPSPPTHPAGLTTHVSPQIALIDLLTAMGLTPNGIVGHSLGEVACGYADGCMTQEEAVLAAYWRGQCIKEAHIPPGAMAAVGKQGRVGMGVFLERGWARRVGAAGHSPARGTELWASLALLPLPTQIKAHPVGGCH